MPIWPARGHHQNSLDRMELSLGKMSETFGTFREELATIKSEQDGQRRQIIEIESDWKSGLESVNQAIGKLSARMEERDKPKIGFWVSSFSVLFLVMTSMITVGVFFVQSTIREETTPLRQQISQVQQATSNLREIENSATRSTTADARSEQDRSEINRRLTADELEIATMQAKSAERFTSLGAGFIENETQFKNLMSLVYYLWNQVTKSPFPIVPREAPLMPSFGNR